MSGLTDITPEQARGLKDEGALFVDVREAHEYAGGFIPGSHHAALSAWQTAELPLEDGQAVVFLCASGNRTTVNANALAAKAGGAQAYNLRGGIFGWMRSGLPVERPAHGHTGGQAGRGLLGRLFGG